MSPEKWARLRAKTNDQVLSEARVDPTALPVEDRKPGRLGPIGRVSLAKRIRWALRMSQVEFAKTFRIPLGTLRDWEQHRRDPDQAAQAYLEVIAREPEAVRRARPRRPKPATSPRSSAGAGCPTATSSSPCGAYRARISAPTHKSERPMVSLIGAM
jgi:putative transcriptional regulator